MKILENCWKRNGDSSKLKMILTFLQMENFENQKNEIPHIFRMDQNQLVARTMWEWNSRLSFDLSEYFVVAYKERERGPTENE